MFKQAELDAIIAKRLAKVQKDMETKIAEAKAEGERLAKLSEAERKKAEEDANRKKLEDREREITRRELRAGAMEKLAEKGLPKGLAEVLDYTDEDSCDNSLKALETAFRTAVNAAVEDRLKGNPPGGGGSGSGAGGGKPDFDKMTDEEFYAWKRAHPNG